MNDATLPGTLVTVSSSGFLPGTLVMLDSFLATNNWFAGEIVVIDAGLVEQDLASLSAFPRLQLTRLSAELANAIERLCNSQPHLRGRAARFASLECFWMETSKPLLFCDGDLLFRADLSDPLKGPGDFLAAPDRARLAGENEHGFNAGLMLMREGVLTGRYRAKILSALDPATWAECVRTQHTDQAVLNQVFGNDAVLLDPGCNWLVGHATRTAGHNAVRLKDAAVWHFNGPTKPWSLLNHANAANANPALVAAMSGWFDAHTAFLTRHVMQHARPFAN